MLAKYESLSETGRGQNEERTNFASLADHRLEGKAWAKSEQYDALLGRWGVGRCRRKDVRGRRGGWEVVQRGTAPKGNGPRDTAD